MKKFFIAIAILALAGSAITSLAKPIVSESIGSDQVLFGLTFFGNQFVTIDGTTGQAALVGTADDNLTGYGLAAYQGSLYTFNPNKNEIDQISVIDGHVVSRKAFGVSGLQGEGDLAIRSDTGIGFVASALDGSGNPTHPFYTFDVHTGLATKLGNTSVAVDGLAFDQSQTLYAIGQGDNSDTGTADPASGNAMLYTVNQLTGALTAVGSLGVPQNSPVGAITFAPNGKLYAAIDDQLYTIDTTTGAATLVNPSSPYFGFSSVSGLAVSTGISDLLNISTRANVGTGDNVAIAGFMIRAQASASPSPQPTATPSPGTAGPQVAVVAPTPATKEVVLRAIGPSLSFNGMPIKGTLSDPNLTLYDSNGNQIAFNEDYKDNDAADQARIAEVGLTPSDDRESVIVRSLPEGDYTAIIRGKNNTTGIGLVEVYDTSSGNGEKLTNISTRANTGDGDNVSISGIIISGSLQKRVIFRGIGPSLQKYGITNYLADPVLQLFDVNGNLVATNDNWKEQDPGVVADIMSSGLAPSDDREAVISMTINPGAYTAILRGAGNSNNTGIGLVESYDRD